MTSGNHCRIRLYASCHPAYGRQRLDAYSQSAFFKFRLLDEWRAVVGATVAAAKAGDASARNWLAQYLMGKAALIAPAPMRLVVEHLSGRDPLVESLAEAPIERMKYPGLYDDDDEKDRIRDLIAAELRALAAQKTVAPESTAPPSGGSAAEPEPATTAEAVN